MTEDIEKLNDKIEESFAELNRIAISVIQLNQYIEYEMIEVDDDLTDNILSLFDHYRKIEKELTETLETIFALEKEHKLPISITYRQLYKRMKEAPKLF